jgi:hypothetical protein
LIPILVLGLVRRAPSFREGDSRWNGPY